jgi:hypothetical protein
MKRFRYGVFFITILVFWCLFVITFYCASLLFDENGTGINLAFGIMKNIIYVLGFPTVILFRSIFIRIHDPVIYILPTRYLIGLLINSIFYGLLIERIFYLVYQPPKWLD